MPRLKSLRFLKHCSLWAYRLATYLVLLVGFVFAAIVLSLRYWLLPQVDTYRGDIAAALSRASGQRISIGAIDTSWDGLRPQLMLTDVQVFDSRDRPALALSRVDSTLAWRSVLFLEPRFHSLIIYKPELSVRRDADGVISVAGIEMNRPQEGRGFSDWLLRQDAVSVHEASVVWLDELRRAPELELQNVELHLENSGNHHRFGLQATPPEHLAGPLDLRGDVDGDTVRELRDWRGRLFLQVGYLDLAAWRSWVPYPVTLPRGAGALRMWLDVADYGVQQVIADVRLANVRTRLAEDLQDLDLPALNGRFGWRSLRNGFEFSTARLELSTSGGLTLQPADFSLRQFSATDKSSARGEIRANALDLEPLVALADHLPIDAEMRKRLVAFSPRGSVYDVSIKWAGELPQPSQYSAKGRFSNVAVNAQGRIPGFAGVSGSIDANEKSGTLYLNNQASTVNLPLLFAQPVPLDVLTAQVNWIVSPENIDLRLANVAFANGNVAGTLNAHYQAPAGGIGSIDMTAALSRADVHAVARYLPLAVVGAAREWLESALLAGRAHDVRVRLKGNLADFPFADGKSGTFQVTAGVADGVLAYASGWPRIENISADLAVRGNRLEISSNQASMFDARLSNVKAVIADLLHRDEVLVVTGDAEGPTADFLKFIGESPVGSMVDNMTEEMRAQGRGKLNLKLELPLRRRKEVKVSGAYQFINNQLTPDPDLPPLEQINGRLEFTESQVRVANASALIFGGPVTISAQSQREGNVRISMQGRANVDAMRKIANVPWLASVQGAADWRTTVNLRKKLADITVESNLVGITSELPAPFAKAAADSVPLRIEKTMTGVQEDRIVLSYGSVVAAQLQRRREGSRSIIDRGVVSFGAASTPPPERRGIALSGSLPMLDVDQWRATLGQLQGGPELELNSINLKVATLHVLGRSFSDLSLTAREQNNAWVTSLSGREVNGDLTWRPQGKGRVVARLRQLIIPASVPSVRAPAADKAQTSELPAIDLVADNFQIKDMKLGRLELTAIPDGRDWRIDKLQLVNSDAALTADGLWQIQGSNPRTQFNAKLEVGDIGKFLTRLGYPEGVRRGTASLDATLNWAGGPVELDYPTLSGTVVLEAAKGQFVKLDPGIGKLLGILSLQALPRRITLDFKDVFSEGFAFDEILGSVKIARGMATTDNFRISGPAARIVMSGDVDLAQETQRLRVRVTPVVGDSVSTVTGLLGGPIVGIGIFLAQKLLDDPLGKMAAYEYSITGTWADPHVAKPQAQAAEKK